MNDVRKSKLKRFVNDEALSEAVYLFLQESFLSDKSSKEVNYLAASRLSIDFLKKAWVDLEKFRDDADKAPAGSPNVGL